MVVGNVVPLLTLPLITRRVSVDDYGAWALAGVYGAFITSLASLGLPLSVERNLFEQQSAGDRGRLLYSAVVVVGALTALTIGVTWWFGPALAQWLTGRKDDATLIVLTTTSSAVLSLKAFYLLYLRNTSAAGRYVRYSIDETILGSSATLLLLFGTPLGVLALAAGQLLAVTVVFLLATRHMLTILPFGFRPGVLRDSLRIGYPLTIKVLFGAVGKNADKYFVSQLVSVGGVGAYSVGQRVSYLVFAYTTALENVFSPAVYRRMFAQEPGGGAAIGRYLTPFAYASVAIALVIALFAREILLVIAPAEYHGALPVIAILSLYYAVLFFGKQPQLMYAKKTMVSTVLSMATIGITVVLNYWFIRWYGLMGAAWATLTAGVVSTALVTVVGQRSYRIDWEWGKLALMFGWLAGGVAVSWAAAEWRLGLLAGLAVKTPVIAGYLALGILLGIVTRVSVAELLHGVSARFRGRSEEASSPVSS